MVITRSWQVARIVLPRGISSRLLGLLLVLLAGACLFSFGQVLINMRTAAVDRPSPASGVLAYRQQMTPWLFLDDGDAAYALRSLVYKASEVKLVARWVGEVRIFPVTSEMATDNKCCGN